MAACRSSFGPAQLQHVAQDGDAAALSDAARSHRWAGSRPAASRAAAIEAGLALKASSISSKLWSLDQVQHDPFARAATGGRGPSAEVAGGDHRVEPKRRGHRQHRQRVQREMPARRADLEQQRRAVRGRPHDGRIGRQLHVDQPPVGRLAGAEAGDAHARGPRRVDIRIGAVSMSAGRIAVPPGTSPSKDRRLLLRDPLDARRRPPDGRRRPW